MTNIKDKQRILDPGALEGGEKKKEKNWVLKNHSSRTFPELKKNLKLYWKSASHIWEHWPKMVWVLNFKDERKDLLDI